MAKDFSFPFYINNWIGGVMYYTFEQKGAYLELLLLQFNHGKFTETQVKQVLNICYSNVWPVIKEKFQTDGQFYWNERMEEVKNERKAYVESRRNNRLGKTKVTTKDEHMLITSKTYEKHMEGESKDKDKIKNEKLILPFESENFKNTWYKLIAEKKWRKKSNAALQTSLNKLAKYPEADAIEMMLNTIAGEWQGLFELKKHNNGTEKKNLIQSISDGHDKVQGVIAAIRLREINSADES